ncbi:MAG: substrate-binding domain-containing protein [bacterium]
MLVAGLSLLRSRVAPLEHLPDSEGTPMAPLFEQVRTGIAQAIADGRFDIGQTLPAVETLASQHRCGANTMHRALAELADAGVLKRVRNRGTIVMRRPPLARACLILADDEHTNVLLQDKVYDALTDANIDVELLPGKLDVDQLRRRIDQMRRQAPAPEALVTLRQHWPDGMFDVLEHAFACRVAYRYDSQGGLDHTYTVGPDLNAMAYQVVKHLVDLGHRRIAVAHGFPHESATWVSQTAELARNFFELAGGTCFMHQAGESEEAALLKLIREQGVTAYWSINDHIAMGWETRLLRHGIRVPEDLSIVGRWDTPWAQTAPTPLTTVSFDPDATGRALADVLVQLVRGQAPAARMHPVAPQLIARHSTAPLGGISRTEAVQSISGEADPR